MKELNQIIVFERWFFDSRKTAIIGLKKGEFSSDDAWHKPDLAYGRFRITDQTIIAGDVLERWWNHPPLVIVYNNVRHYKSGLRSVRVVGIYIDEY